ncbi:unnamed protein product [Amoebophrya sp. A120]|nr:unnamed protein product [Amoebophrya sp. A120]|eukprot:GSA120T00007416001.1
MFKRFSPLLGRGRPKCADFLEFGGFCEYVRELKFRDVLQYQNWVRHGSCPKMIPHCPDKVYKDRGWVSWRHALGYTHECKHNKVQDFDELPRAETLWRGRGMTNNRVAQEQFYKQITGATSDFEFLWVRGGLAGLLFRRTGAPDKRWCAIQVRTAECRRKAPSGEMKFRLVDVGVPATDAGILVVAPSENKMQLFAHSELEACCESKTTACRNSIWMSDIATASTCDLTRNLFGLWDVLPRFECAEWMRILVRSRLHRLHALVIPQLIDRLYKPSGLPYSFVTKWGKLNASDMIVGPARMLHRTGVHTRQRDGRIKVKATAEVKTDTKEVQRFTLDTGDPFDYLVVPVHVDEVVRGVYALPKVALASANVLSRNRVGGRSAFTLYPPGCGSDRRVQYRAIPGEERFYVDMSSSGVEVEKFAGLLRDHSDSTTGASACPETPFEDSSQDKNDE